MTQQYKNDMKFERAVAKFMDSNFYVPKFGQAFRRRDDMESQMRGVDLTVEIGGKTVSFDEKAKEANYGGPVSFEMTLMKNGEEREGWFGGSWAQADVIATLTPSSKDKYPTSPDAITSVDVLWTVKKTLREWVESFGMTLGQLMEDAKELRREVEEGSMISRKRYPHGQFWLTLSSGMDEEPVNLVIPRKTLERLSAKRFKVESAR